MQREDNSRQETYRRVVLMRTRTDLKWLWPAILTCICLNMVRSKDLMGTWRCHSQSTPAHFVTLTPRSPLDQGLQCPWTKCRHLYNCLKRITVLQKKWDSTLLPNHAYWWQHSAIALEVRSFLSSLGKLRVRLTVAIRPPGVAELNRFSPGLLSSLIIGSPKLKVRVWFYLELSLLQWLLGVQGSL